MALFVIPSSDSIQLGAIYLGIWGVKTKMVFQEVASKEDLTLGKMLGLTVSGKGVLIVNVDGKYYSMADECTHMGCKLSEGELNKGIIECPCHYARFDVKTGKIVQGPAKVPASIFQVKSEGDTISVNV